MNLVNSLASVIFRDSRPLIENARKKLSKKTSEVLILKISNPELKNCVRRRPTKIIFFFAISPGFEIQKNKRRIFSDLGSERMCKTLAP